MLRVWSLRVDRSELVLKPRNQPQLAVARHLAQVDGLEEVAALGEGLGKLCARHPLLQADEKRRAGRGMGDIPVFGLRLAVKGRRHCCRRMYLEAEAIGAVQPLDEEGEMGRWGPAGTHELVRMPLDQFAKAGAGKRSSLHPRLGLRPVDDLPAFPDGRAGWQFAPEQGVEPAAAPHPFLVKRL